MNYTLAKRMENFVRFVQIQIQFSNVNLSKLFLLFFFRMVRVCSLRIDFLWFGLMFRASTIVRIHVASHLDWLHDHSTILLRRIIFFSFFSYLGCFFFFHCVYIYYIIMVCFVWIIYRNGCSDHNSSATRWLWSFLPFRSWRKWDAQTSNNNNNNNQTHNET